MATYKCKPRFARRPLVEISVKRRCFSPINKSIFIIHTTKFAVRVWLQNNLPIIQLFIFLHRHGDSQSESSILVADLSYVISREITVKKENRETMPWVIHYTTFVMLFLWTLHWLFQAKPVLDEFVYEKTCKCSCPFIAFGRALEAFVRERNCAGLIESGPEEINY